MSDWTLEDDTRIVKGQSATTEDENTKGIF